MRRLPRRGDRLLPARTVQNEGEMNVMTNNLCVCILFMQSKSLRGRMVRPSVSPMRSETPRSADEAALGEELRTSSGHPVVWHGFRNPARIEDVSLETSRVSSCSVRPYVASSATSDTSRDGRKMRQGYFCLGCRGFRSRRPSPPPLLRR